jgi:hypothetical protein
MPSKTGRSSILSIPGCVTARVVFGATLDLEPSWLWDDALEMTTKAQDINMRRII